MSLTSVLSVNVSLVFCFVTHDWSHHCQYKCCGSNLTVTEWWAEFIVNIHCQKTENKKDIWRSKGDSAMSKMKVEEDGRMFKTKTWINESEQDTRSYQEFEGRTRYESPWREMEPHSVFCYVFLCYVAQIRRWYIFSMYSYVCMWTCSFLCTIFIFHLCLLWHNFMIFIVVDLCWSQK